MFVRLCFRWNLKHFNRSEIIYWFHIYSPEETVKFEQSTHKHADTVMENFWHTHTPTIIIAENGAIEGIQNYTLQLYINIQPTKMLMFINFNLVLVFFLCFYIYVVKRAIFLSVEIQLDHKICLGIHFPSMPRYLWHLKQCDIRQLRHISSV